MFMQRSSVMDAWVSVNPFTYLVGTVDAQGGHIGQSL